MIRLGARVPLSDRQIEFVSSLVSASREIVSSRLSDRLTENLERQSTSGGLAWDFSVGVPITSWSSYGERTDV